MTAANTPSRAIVLPAPPPLLGRRGWALCIVALSRAPNAPGLSCT